MSKFKLPGFALALSFLLPCWALAQAPSITTQPTAQVVAPAANVTFTVVAAGNPTLIYQWKKDSVNVADASGHIAGSTTATLTITGATVADVGSYTVTVTNGSGNVTSTPAALALLAPSTASPGTNPTTSSFTASWTAVSGATGYQIDVSPARTFSTYVTGFQALDVGSALTVDVTGLNADTTYFYRIRPYNAAGVGGSSTLSSLVIGRTSATTTPIAGGTEILHDTLASVGSGTAINDNLSLDSNSYFVPTATQAVWFEAGSGSGFTTVPGGSISLSAGSRGVLAYFEPSSSVASLSVGETLSATVRFKYTDGNGTATPSPGDLRVGLLNSNGNGTNVNVADATNAQNPARLTAQNFSLTGGGSIAARGYSGYVVDTTASTTAPTADSITFWQRIAATVAGTGGTTQWLGPTSSDLPGSVGSTFVQVGAAGGGTIGTIANDSKDYVLNLSVKMLSASEAQLSYTVTTSGTVVQSYSVTQSTGDLVTSFDTLFLFSTFNGSLHVLELDVKKLPPAPVITTQPVSQAATIGSSVSFTVAADSTGSVTYQWQKKPASGSFANINGATSATLSLANVQTDDAADYQVIVTNAGGSTTSATASLAVGPAPEIPVGSAGDNIGSEGFTANWASVTGATGYRLDVSKSNTFDTFVTGYEDLDVGLTLSQAIADLTPNTVYYYRVRAYNTYGAGLASEPVQVTTGAPTGPVTSETILSETFPLPTPDIIPPATSPPAIADVNAGLVVDSNGFATPTSDQAAWATFGTGSVKYTHNTSINISSSSSGRGFMAYFEPSTSLASLAIGETLSATVTFSFNGGTTAERAGNFRLALLNSGGNGTASNVGGSARYAANTSNSLTSGAPGRGYSGYIIDTEAAATPTTDTQSFWLRTAAADSASGSTQIVGPTSGDITTVLPSSTFSLIGAAGGGTAGAILDDGTAYTATLSVTYVSATEVDLDYIVKQGDTTVMSYSTTQTSGNLVTSFDSFMFFSVYGGSPTILGLDVVKLYAAPVIATPPAGKSITVGETTTLSVDATGTAPLTYKWKKDGAPLSDASGHITGSATASLTLTNAQLADSGSYTVVVTNVAGTVTSDAATVTVSAALQPPAITTQPTSTTVAFGGTASFSVVSSGTPPLLYQWSKNGDPISAATSATLQLTNVQAADAATYSVNVSNGAGDVTSNAVTLTVTPAITTQPKSQTALTGSVVTLSVVATGTGPFTYQWRKGGTPIDGATSPNLILTNVSSADIGSYTVVVTDGGGSITSSAAALDVNETTVKLPAQPSIPDTVFNILDYLPQGASLPGGIHPAGAAPTVYTSAIQAAIDDAASHGGGIVEIPAAADPYLTGPLTLHDKINLQIDGGATLKALPYGTYPDANLDLITAPSGSTDVAITGAGTIEGDGSAWWTAYNADNTVNRPRLLQFTRASRVLISGITLQNSPQFHIAFSNTNDNITISGVTITAPSNSPNTDGIDPAGTNILIQNCSISVGDDNIAVKPGSATCSALTIAYCTFGTGHGLSVGGQTNAGLDGMTVVGCTFTGTTSGLRLKADATQGGTVKNVTYTNLKMTNVAYPIVFYSYYNENGTPGSASGGNAVGPDTVATRNAAAIGGSAIPKWQNITIDGLTATGATGYSIIWGLPLKDALFTGVKLNNVSITGTHGLKVYNAVDVQFTGTTAFSELITANALVLSAQPEAKVVNAGDTTTFSVTAAGTSIINLTAPTYRWNLNGVALSDGLQLDGSTIAGATTSQLTVSQIRLGDAGSYSCTVSSQLDGRTTTTAALAADALAASATSAGAPLTVNYPDANNTPTIPSVTTAPHDQSVNAGDTVHFSVVATDTYPITAYVWKKDGTVLADGGRISGATTANLTITGATTADAGSYTVSVWNEAGPVSKTVTLTVSTPPSITTQPAGPASAVLEGVDVSFTVAASGTDPLSYVWSKDGSVLTDDDAHISGATTATLTLTGVVLADAGSYTVTITNVAGDVTSDAAVLSVRTVPPAPVANAAADIATTHFLASWNTAATATGYRLDVSTQRDFSSYLAGYQDRDLGTKLSQVVVGLSANTTYYYRVRATNDVGASDNSGTITVKTPPVVLAPVITSPKSTTFTLGIASTFTVTATGQPSPTFAATGLPSWLTLNAATGVLSGTAPEGTAGAQIPLVITAQNGVSPSASQSFTVKVQAAPGVSTPMTITTIAGKALTPGSGGSTGSTARFRHPSAVTVDSAGNIYIADTDNNTVRRITAAGAVSTFGASTGTGPTIFNSPSGIAVAQDGAIYVSDTLNHTIRKISGGNITTYLGKAGESGSADQPDTASVGNSLGRLYGPQGLFYHQATTPGADDMLYVADTNNQTIRKIDLISSEMVTIAGLAGEVGSADGTGTAARFNNPSGVAVDRNGVVYVADTDNNTIRAISPSGEVRTLAGLAGSSGAADGVGSGARFNHPTALVVDSDLNVYVVDSDNHSIRKITSAAGVVTTVAGLPGTSGSADGTGADARFNVPSGIMQATTGEFYIADTNNDTIRQGVFPGAPAISGQPQSTSVTAGATVQFFVTATGQPAPTYQWQFNGAALDGATGSSLTISNAQAADAGKYTVVVTNSQGSVTSNAATLTVNAPNPSGGVSGGGGGGGAPGLWFYLGLALLVVARRISRRRSAQTLRTLTVS